MCLRPVGSARLRAFLRHALEYGEADPPAEIEAYRWESIELSMYAKAEIDGLECAISTARAGSHLKWVAILSAHINALRF